MLAGMESVQIVPMSAACPDVLTLAVLNVDRVLIFLAAVKGLG
jgi:hypothetical protein